MVDCGSMPFDVYYGGEVDHVKGRFRRFVACASHESPYVAYISRSASTRALRPIQRYYPSASWLLSYRSELFENGRCVSHWSICRAPIFLQVPPVSDMGNTGRGEVLVKAQRLSLGVQNGGDLLVGVIGIEYFDARHLPRRRCMRSQQRPMRHMVTDSSCFPSDRHLDLLGLEWRGQTHVGERHVWAGRD